MGQFNGGKTGGWSYWPEATEPTGWQILDHVFFEGKKLSLKSCTVFRKEILGDLGPSKPYDGNAAISDHAAIMVTLTPR